MAFSVFGSSTLYTASTTIDPTATLIKTFKDKNNNPVYQIKNSTWNTNGNKYVWCKPVPVTINYTNDAAIDDIRIFRTASGLYGAPAGNDVEVTNGEFFYGDNIEIRYYLKDGYRLDNCILYLPKTYVLDENGLTISSTDKPYTTKEVLLTIRLDNAEAFNITEVTSTTGIEALSNQPSVVSASNSDSGVEEHLYKYWLTTNNGTAQYTIQANPKTGYQSYNSNISKNYSYTTTQPVSRYSFYKLKYFNVGVTAGYFWSQKGKYSYSSQSFTDFPSLKVYVQRNNTNYPTTGFEDSNNLWTSNTTTFNSSSSSTTSYSTSVSSPVYKQVYYGDYVTAYNRTDTIVPASGQTVNNSANPYSTSPMITSNMTLVLNVESEPVSVPSSESSVQTITFNQNQISYGTDGIIDLLSIMQSNLPGWGSNYRIKSITATDKYNYPDDYWSGGANYGRSNAPSDADTLLSHVTYNAYTNSSSSSSYVSDSYYKDGDYYRYPVTLKVNELRGVSSYRNWPGDGQVFVSGWINYYDDSGGETWTDDNFYLKFRGSESQPKLQNMHHVIGGTGSGQDTDETYYGNSSDYKFSITLEYYGYTSGSTYYNYNGTYSWGETPTVSSARYQSSGNNIYILIYVLNASSLIGSSYFKVKTGTSAYSYNPATYSGMAYVKTITYSQNMPSFRTAIQYPGIPTMYYDVPSDYFYYIAPSGGK